MHELLILNNISKKGLQVFDKRGWSYGSNVSEPEAIVVRSQALHDMQFSPGLKAIARAGAGVNNIPIERCSENGIVVFNTPGGNANAVKELVLMGLLISARRVFPAMTWVQSLAGAADLAKEVEAGKSKFIGPELMGKSLGVIGLGAIGVQVANTAVHFGMEVYGYDPYLSVEAAWGLSRSIHHAETLREIYSQCDYITVHVPCTNETRGMINASAFGQMKPGVRILNFARAELIDTADMLAALQSRQVRCYVTDFPLKEFVGHPGVLTTPHLGATTPESEDNCAYMAAKQLVDFLENGCIKNSVNLPDVHMPRNGGSRVCIINKNIPSMISQISQAFSDEHVNIDNLTNKSKRDLAYTMIDIGGDITPSALTRLREIDGVIRINLYGPTA